MRVKARLTISRRPSFGVAAGLLHQPTQAQRSLEPEPERCDPEKREKPDHVRDRGHEGARCHGRVRAHALEYHRNQYAAKRASDEIAYDRQSDDHTKAGNPEP